MEASGSIHPALEDLINRAVEVFDPAANFGREGTREDRRQSQRRTGGRQMRGQLALWRLPAPSVGSRQTGRPSSLPGGFAVCSMGYIIANGIR